MNEIKCPKCGAIIPIDEDAYASIVKQVKDNELKSELDMMKSQFEKDIELSVQKAESKLKEKFTEDLSKKDAEIADLKSEIKLEQQSKETEIDKQVSKKNKEIADLQNKLDSFNKDKELAIANIKAELNDQISAKDSAIQKITTEKNLAEKEHELNEQSLKKQYEERIRFKDEEIERYKDFKARLSTKMIGESLEQHCEIEFNKLRATAFKNAEFGKDNDASKGTKGDYIFRDKDSDGTEFISIMFEMKNEMDSSSNAKKNEEFFKKLDKDRAEKHCEYAVLVSMLEPENELYNSGIVDVSHRYPKMYVIRPQFFIPIITLLRNAALNSLEYQKELAEIKAKNIDVSKFEDELEDFKGRFSKNYGLASRKFVEAIEEIDKTITHLKKTKEALESTVRNLGYANDKAQDLTIRSLTKNNPTMKTMFEDLKQEPPLELPKDDA